MQKQHAAMPQRLVGGSLEHAAGARSSRPNADSVEAVNGGRQGRKAPCSRNQKQKQRYRTQAFLQAKDIDAVEVCCAKTRAGLSVYGLSCGQAVFSPDRTDRPVLSLKCPPLQHKLNYLRAFGRE